MQVLSVTGVPNRFVLLPEPSSFMDAFYKKYILFFICDHGYHLVKGDDMGYSMMQVNNQTWKSHHGDCSSVNLHYDKKPRWPCRRSYFWCSWFCNGAAEIANENLSKILKNSLVKEIEDIGQDVLNLTKGLESLEQCISKLQTKEDQDLWYSTGRWLGKDFCSY